jgi:hypothetical protein
MIKKEQPQMAVVYLERIVKWFPTSQLAEQARGKLALIRGVQIADK